MKPTQIGTRCRVAGTQLGVGHHARLADEGNERVVRVAPLAIPQCSSSSPPWRRFSEILETHSLPSGLPLFALAAVFGGAVGSQLGSVHLSAAAIYRILGAILLIAGIKLICAVA